jgi:CRP-like cAMP-binding protein
MKNPVSRRHLQAGKNAMQNQVWYLDNFDFYQVLCPYKFKEHLEKHPTKSYPKGTFLFMQDEPAKDIFLIDRGKVKVGNYDDLGNERLLAILGRGEVLGTRAILGERQWHSFAEVIEDNTQVCRMSVEKAMELTRDYSPFAVEMHKRIAGDIRRLERRIEILLFKDIKTRLVEFLKDFAKDSGRPRDGGTIISHSLTQSDIAALIGTSRKSASLLLNELEDKGLIRFDRKQIFIPDVEELAAFVAGKQLAV